MKTRKNKTGYKLEYKGVVRYVCNSVFGWVVYDDADFCYGGGCGLPTLKEQKESIKYLVDNGLMKKVKDMKHLKEQVDKAVSRQTWEDILSINQIEYRERLREYFSRVDAEEFNLDIIHDIEGLKRNDEHFLTRL